MTYIISHPGAVSFGLNPTVVSTRRCPLTYGASVLNRFVPGKHPTSKLVRRRDDSEWCKDVFDVFVSADQPIVLGEVVERTYVTAAADQKRMTVDIYCSKNKLPAFVTDPDVRKCANINLDLSSTMRNASTATEGTGRRLLLIRMEFSLTEIKVTAVDTRTGSHVDSSIDFINI